MLQAHVFHMKHDNQEWSDVMAAGMNRYTVFLKAAELGSLTRAAQALHDTQSGVSHAIAALEQEAGTPLFTFDFHVYTLPLEPAHYRTLGIASLPPARLSPVARTFLNFLRETDVTQLETK